MESVETVVSGILENLILKIFTNRKHQMTEQSNEIQNISDLTQILKELGEPTHGKIRFFRGQAKEWELLPSIYRKDKPYYIENEDKIIKDALTNCPDDFPPNDTLFEKLVKLQHYGYATRLLDLTANALVALYFACSNEDHHDENGELIVLDIPDSEIKYADSDTVAILAAISAQNKNFSLSDSLDYAQTKYALAEANYILENLDQDRLKSIENSINNKLLPFKNIDEYEEIVQKVASEIGESAFISSFNEQPPIISLLHDIHTDKPSFRPVIKPTDLTRVLCVRAKLNNARISRQQGCFLLFGINNEKRNPAEIPDDWKRLPTKGKRFIVRNKKQIMQELKAFGISRQTLFPELESQAQEIMSQYKPK